MEMIDIQNMLDALAHSENLSDIPGMQKMKADQSHHDAVHKAPALDPQGEEQFRQWLAARDGEAEDLSVLRSVFVMEQQLLELEEGLAAIDDSEDRGRAMHAFWIRWRSLLGSHAHHMDRYMELRSRLWEEGAN